MDDSRSLLQHPRRNLGNRYRSTALKFAKLAVADPSRAGENLAWAEQNARQAILYDFTDERNWHTLVELKELNNDEAGLHAVLEDVFSVLGRDPEQVDQLATIDLMSVGKELLHAAFVNDPLDPEEWWATLQSSDRNTTAQKETLEAFAQRCRRLDFRDHRANIVFGRRLERLKEHGHLDLFVELAKHLLAHRPANHELWMELGRLQERRNEIDEAWICYDHVQRLRPQTPARDLFLARLKTSMDGETKTPWSGPTVEHRQSFLASMEALTERVSVPLSPDAKPQRKENNGTQVELSSDEQRLTDLIEQGDLQKAFFTARRLVATGEDWAEDWMEKIQNLLEQ